MNTLARTSSGPWWIHPGRLTAIFLVPLYAFLVYVVPARWPEVLVLKAPDYLHTGGYAGMGLVMLGCIAVGAFVGARIVTDRAEPRAYRVRQGALIGIGAVTIVAYVIWFFPVLLHGRLLLERDELSRTPGITSFTQMGVPFVLCYLYCTRVCGQPFSWIVTAQFRAILVLTLLRVFVWKERLAAIEVFVPAAVLLLSRPPPADEAPARRAVRQAISKGGPFVAVPLLMIVFTITEYFRSWTTYSQTQSASLGEFMLARITSYYYTALNNGAGLLTTTRDHWPNGRLLYVAEWAYHLPGGVGDALYQTFIGEGQHPTDTFLEHFADPEFNNMSGLFPIVYDVGVAGAMLYFAAFGFAAGMLYRLMVRQGHHGYMLYPPVMVALLEVLRVSYLNGSRAVLLVVGAFLLLGQMRPTVRVGAPAQRAGVRLGASSP